jgi:outer membrane murein-binding lipoprotein Lpp
MRTIKDIRADLDRAIERRAQLWEELAGGVDPAKSSEAAELTKKIDDLWAEARALKAHERFGPSEIIRARARAEERLDREARRLDRRAA